MAKRRRSCPRLHWDDCDDGSDEVDSENEDESESGDVCDGDDFPLFEEEAHDNGVQDFEAASNSDLSADSEPEISNLQELLLAAVSSGDVSTLTELLAGGVEGADAEKAINMAMMIAATQGRPDCVQYFCTHPYFHGKLDDGYEPLRWPSWLQLAALAGQASVVRVLCEHGAGRARNEKVLMSAARSGDLRTFQYLAENSLFAAQLTALAEDRNLMFFAGSADVAQYLIERGLDVKATDQENFTPLHEAAGMGFLDVVRFLLRHGAEIDAVSTEGTTPLHVACATATTNAHVEVCSILIRKGASVMTQTNARQTPMHFAAAISTDGDPTAVEFNVRFAATSLPPAFRQMNVGAISLRLVTLLQAAGSDLFARDEDGWAPWHGAAEAGNLPVFVFLFETYLTQALAASDSDSDAEVQPQKRQRHLTSQQPQLQGAATNSEEVHDDNSEISSSKPGPDEPLGDDSPWWAEDRTTPLHLAAENGHLFIVQYLLQKGELHPGLIAIDELTEDEMSALQLAARENHVSVVEALLEHGAKIEFEDENGEPSCSALFYAASEGHLETAKLLLKHGADVNAGHQEYVAYNCSPLKGAIENGHLELVKLLCKKGAQLFDGCLELAVESGNVQLFQCLASQLEPEDVQNFLQNGLEYEGDGIEDQENGSEDEEAGLELGENLMFLAARGSGEMLDFLRRQGGSLEQRDGKRRTLLHEAAWWGSLGAVEYLAQSGADINAFCMAGQTPVHRARTADVIRYLHEHGSAIDASSDDGSTPLHTAAQAARVDVMEYLLNNGANINARANDGTTPLIRLFVPDPKNIPKVDPDDFSAALDLLIRRGAELDARDQGQRTVVHYASIRASIPELRRLCTDQNVSAQDQEGSTPLHLIQSDLWQSAETIERILLLIEQGAKLWITNRTGRSVLDHLLDELDGAHFVELMSRIVEDFPHSLQEDIQRDVQGSQLSPEQWSILFHRVPIDRCKLFLVGDGGAGKTALRHSLRQVRDLSDPEHRRIEELDDPEDPASRTLGIEFDNLYLRSDGVPAIAPVDDAISVCIQDHGGQRSFHVVHDLFFQSAYAVYALVIRVDTNDEEAVRVQLEYWLNFLCSTVRTAGDVVVVLSGWREGLRMDRKRRVVVNKLQQTARTSNSELRFVLNPMELDCRKSGSERMRAFRAALHQQFQTQLATRLMMPAACEALREHVLQLRGSRIFCQRRELLAEFWELDQSWRFVTPTLFEKLCEYLQQTGDLLLLPSSWIAVDPNRFTNQVIGSLFKPATLGGAVQTGRVTEDEINRITSASQYFTDVHIMPSILEFLGLCIRLPASQSPGESQAAYFPCFVEELFEPAVTSEIVTGDTEVHLVGCRFQLAAAEEEKRVFSGLFPKLFAKLYSALTPPTAPETQHPRLWRNAILLHRRADGRDVRILVDYNLRTAASYFDVIVWCEPTQIAESLHWLTRACHIVSSREVFSDMLGNISLLRPMTALDTRRDHVTWEQLQYSQRGTAIHELQNLLGLSPELEDDECRMNLHQLEKMLSGNFKPTGTASRDTSNPASSRSVMNDANESSRFAGRRSLSTNELVKLTNTLTKMRQTMDHLYFVYENIFFDIPDGKRNFIQELCNCMKMQLGGWQGEPQQPDFGFTSTTGPDYLSCLYDACRDELPRFSQVVENLKVTDSELRVCRELKKLDRIMEKAMYCYQDDYSRVVDIVRGSIVARSEVALIEALELIHRRAMDGCLHIRRIKNRFDAEYRATESYGYRDIQLIIVLPGSGILAELQLHLRRVMEVKSGGGNGHAAYVSYRTLKERVEFYSREV